MFLGNRKTSKKYFYFHVNHYFSACFLLQIGYAATIYVNESVKLKRK